ncbi:MAG: ABC transporter substrate-binding protein [Halobacteriales archaeon]
MSDELPDGITDEDLSGPVIDRRTTLKIFSAAAASSAFAGCSGGGGQGTATPAATPTPTETEMMTETPTETATEAETETETPSQGEQSNKRGGSITAGWVVSEITNMDEVTNSIGVNEQAAMPAYNGLLVTDPQLRLRGEVAKDWEVGGQGTEYTFQLREGIQFHQDYGEVTADDVKFTLMRGLTAEGSTSRPKLKNIAEPYDKNIEVLGDYEIRVTLAEPFIPFLKGLSRGGGACSPVPEQAIKDLGKQFRVTPVSCGPFEVQSHNVGSQIKFRRFEDYWKTDENGVQLPYLDSFTIKPLANASTVINGLLGGDLQYIQALPLQNLSQVRDSDSASVKSAPAGGWGALYFNTNQPKFKDRKVRQGVAKLIDQETYVKRAAFGANMWAMGALSPIHGFANRPRKEKDQTQAFNPEEGKRLLQEAGYSASNPLQFRQLAEKAEQRSHRVLNQMLNKYDILDVEFNPVDQSTFDKRLQGKEGSQYYDTAIWGSDIDLTPDTTMYFFFTKYGEGGAYNNMRYENDRVHKWLNQQRKIPDQNKRAELFQKAEDQVIRDAPCAFLQHFRPHIATSKKLQNVIVHPFRRPMEGLWTE